jgi:hypothetical protein
MGGVGVANLGHREVPAGINHLSVWDVLRTFRASPANGWDTDLRSATSTTASCASSIAPSTFTISAKTIRSLAQVYRAPPVTAAPVRG